METKLSNTSVLGSLSYQAPFLIEKLLKERIVESEKEANALFLELKRYIVIAYLDDTICWDMYSRRIDEVWHQFVLFTKEYTDFSEHFFGRYIHHVPGNSQTSEIDNFSINSKESSFEDFKHHYEEMFKISFPIEWYDEVSININRRVVNHDAGRFGIRDDGKTVHLINKDGDVLLSVNQIARESLLFISKVNIFYVRELPGSLTDEEKVSLTSILVKYNLLRVAP